MIDNAERNISSFYNGIGWENIGENTEDSRRFEDLRDNARDYVSKCRLRVLRHIPAAGKNILDMASGPIQYPEYLEYSKNYTKRYCVDLSAKALDVAKQKIGSHGEFLCGSFFDLDLPENFFDCSLSFHTIYHMDKDKQEEAVRKLIAVTKPEQPIIIIYRNPHTLLNYFVSPLRRLKKFFKQITNNSNNDVPLYAFAHPISWWTRFESEAEIEMFPWRSFFSPHQKILVPNNQIGKKMFKILFDLEEKYPNFFVHNFQYPMIVLTKKAV